MIRTPQYRSPQAQLYARFFDWLDHQSPEKRAAVSAAWREMSLHTSVEDREQVRLEWLKRCARDFGFYAYDS